MKITLINPVTKSRVRVLRVERCQQKVIPGVGIWPPVTLLEIEAKLREKGFFDIDIIDAEAEEYSFTELIRQITIKSRIWQWCRLLYLR